MNTLSIEECNRDLQALDVADKLTANMRKEIEGFKATDIQKLLKQAIPMLMTGNVSLEALGLPANLFEQIEQLAKLNEVARNKYRQTVLANKIALEKMEDVNTLNGVEYE